MPSKHADICPKTDNFYGAINDKWQTATDIPDTETRITQAFFIREKINVELDQLIRAEIKKPAGPNPIKDLVKSWTVAESAPVLPHLSPIIQMMQSMNTTSDISTRMGWMNRVGIAAPISVYVQGDQRDHTRCRIFIEEGEPRIGIPEYWTFPEYVDTRRAYVQYCEALARIIGIPALATAYISEREISKLYPTGYDRRSLYRQLNMVTWTELRATYTKIDWIGLLKNWGLSEEDMPKYMYNVTSPSFMHHLQRRMVAWSMDRWRAWFSLLVIQWVAGISPHGPMRTAWFAYYRKFLQGMKADDTPTDLRMGIVRTLMPNTLGQMWVKSHCDPALKRTMLAMVERIRTAAAAALENTTWMTPSTRKAAIQKLRGMDVQICWPDKWPQTELGCTIRPDNFIDNLLTLNAMESANNIKQLNNPDGCTGKRDGWLRPVFEVNAFYYPEENRFLLPAAILRPPFYDPQKSLAWNYGGIGATIGHEFCHAFDADGRQYDVKGNLKNWWSERDDREYRKRAAQMVKLFESVPYRGMDVDGSLTLTENIADFGGIQFALAGLRAALGRAIKKGELQEFFVSFAVGWRAKDRLRRAAQLLDVDPHAPPLLRVNHTVRQLNEWYEAFDITPDCPGYIPPEKRITFFA